MWGCVEVDVVASHGYGHMSPPPQGLTVLLHGPPGTGKTLAAEAIGYEVGRPLKVRGVGVCSGWVGLIVGSSGHINMCFYLHPSPPFNPSPSLPPPLPALGCELRRAAQQVGGGEHQEH